MIISDVPEYLRKDLLSLIFSEYLRKNGRLILGETGIEEYEDDIVEMGYKISGYCEKIINDGRKKRIVWIDNVYG